jgi:hypothetical protein
LGNFVDIVKCGGCEEDNQRGIYCCGFGSVREIKVVRDSRDRNRARSIGKALWNRLKADILDVDSIIRNSPKTKIVILEFERELIHKHVCTRDNIIEEMNGLLDEIRILQQRFTLDSPIEFYSDGSLSRATEATDCKMGAG